MVRSSGDLAGVFEYDGESGYFYLCETRNRETQRIALAIRILTGVLNFQADDISIRWDGREKIVGLFIKNNLCAAFDAETRAEYGGNYQSQTKSSVPSKIRKVFE